MPSECRLTRRSALHGSKRNRDRGAALASTLHDFEAEWLANEENLLWLMAVAAGRHAKPRPHLFWPEAMVTHALVSMVPTTSSSSCGGWQAMLRTHEIAVCESPPKIGATWLAKRALPHYSQTSSPVRAGASPNQSETFRKAKPSVKPKRCWTFRIKHALASTARVVCIVE